MIGILNVMIAFCFCQGAISELIEFEDTRAQQHLLAALLVACETDGSGVY